MKTLTTTACLTALLMSLVACSTTQPTQHTGNEASPGPDYARALPAGRSALRLVTSDRDLPDLMTAFDHSDERMILGLEESQQWFKAPSSQKFFPFDVPADQITHERAAASVNAFRQLMLSSPDAATFEADVMRLFDIYTSIGCDDRGTVLFTGYYSPIFRASRVRNQHFTYPLYTRPSDLVTDPVTGEPKGRKTPDGGTVPYYTRDEIESSNMFAGNELVWLEDAMAGYIIHVNGSAKLRLDDGEVMYVGYAGKTDRPYRSLGQEIIRAGLLDRSQMSLKAIEKLYEQQPQHVEELIRRNDNYVFFTTYAGQSWPSGSLGVKVTPEYSLATDKKIYPRGGVLLVDTKAKSFTQPYRPFVKFMLDQDTGGAIKAPGRADIFMGIGPMAGLLAGGQYAEGRLYYFFLKEGYVADYANPSGSSHSRPAASGAMSLPALQ